MNSEETIEMIGKTQVLMDEQVFNFDEPKITLSMNKFIKCSEKDYFAIYKKITSKDFAVPSVEMVVPPAKKWWNVTKSNVYAVDCDKIGYFIVRSASVPFAEQMINKINQNNQNTQAGGSKPPIKYRKTTMKVATAKGQRVVYQGPRGGRYIMVNGKYTPVPKSK
jgi:hypothetical protein